MSFLFSIKKISNPVLKPKLSIIVPNYNHSKYLKERLNTIFCQTFQDFEMIILDDFSTDNSIEVIEEYRNHPKVAFIVYNDVNSGSTFRQWEKGISLAKGEYIWIAESDDYSEEMFLEKVFLIFNSIKEVGLVKVFSNWVDENGELLFDKKIDDNLTSPINGKLFIKEHMLIRNNLYNASSIVFRKELVDSSMFDELLLNMKYCGDWLFWIRILYKTNIYILEQKLNYFRRHLNNVSGISEKKGLNFAEGYKIYLSQKDTFLDLRIPFNRFDRAWAKVFNNLSIEIKKSLYESYIKGIISMRGLVFFYKLKKYFKFE